MGFPRQEHWSGLPFLSPGHLPDPGIEPASPALQVDSLRLSHQRSASFRMAHTQNTGITKCWWGMEPQGHSLTTGGHAEGWGLLGRQWWLLTALNMLLSDDTASTLPGIYSKGLKMYVHRKACTWMFIAAFFIIAKADLQATRCPLVDEWISKLVYPNNKICSVLKGNDLPSYIKTWR